MFGRKRAVGLDFDDNEIRAIELVKIGKKIKLVNWGKIDLPLDVIKDGIITEIEQVGQALTELWSERKFKSKDIVIGVANQGVLVRFANLPNVPKDKLDSFIHFQAQDYLPVSIDTIVFDYAVVDEIIEDERKNLQVLLVGAKKEMINDYIRVLEYAKLEPFDIQVSPLSLMRLVDNNTRKETIAIVDVSHRLFTILISEYGVPKLARMMQSGTKELSQDEMPERAGILAGEIHNTIGYYLGNKDSKNIAKIILTGTGAKFKGLAENIENMLNIPTQLINPYQKITIDNKIHKEIGDMPLDLALSISLAMRGMEA